MDEGSSRRGGERAHRDSCFRESGAWGKLNKVWITSAKGTLQRSPLSARDFTGALRAIGGDALVTAKGGDVHEG